MSTPKKDLWDMMCPSDEHLLAEALAKTDEEVAESLRAKGYDLDVLDAQLIGLVDRLPSRKRNGFIVLRAAAIASSIGTVGSGIYALVVANAAPVVTAGALMAASASPATPSEILRDQALQACETSQWDACLAKLDEARALDPEGDEQTRIHDARVTAERALGRKEGGVR